MENSNKPRKLRSYNGDSDELPDWIASLAPIGVAFVCYVGIVLAAGIEPKAEIIASGAAAAFIGIECYWILLGLCDTASV